MVMKKGRLSNAEARYITENAGKTPVEEIASNLDRDPSSIESFINKAKKMEPYHQRGIEYEVEPNCRFFPFKNDLSKRHDHWTFKLLHR